MRVMINEMKILGFVIDDQGKLKTPMFFEMSEAISGRAKRIFKTIAAYAIRHNQTVINGFKFREIIASEHHLDIKTMAALAELKQNHYIEMNI